MIPFKVQFDKLTEAYINNKINPYENCACFIGNLLETEFWYGIRSYSPLGRSVLKKYPLNYPLAGIFLRALETIDIKSERTYNAVEILDLENNFLRVLETHTIEKYVSFPRQEVMDHPQYEEALFLAFSSTLDLLKKIHESKGEVIEEYSFTKRKLETV